MPSSTEHPRVLIVCENASARFGGEAILPLHYFRILRRRGIEAWMIVHQRTQWELSQVLPDQQDRIHYTPDTRVDKFLHGLSRKMSPRVSYATVQLLSRWRNQRHQRRVAQRMVRELGIDVVHQPVPVSPKEASMMYGLGAPVVIGPMNGGMIFPPAFRAIQSRSGELLAKLARRAAGLLNRLFPGKRRAAALLVANDRTRAALPRGMCRNVVTIPENGVDLSIWQPREGDAAHDGPCCFVFSGRLVDWKAVDVLIEAFARVVEQRPATLDILGDGPERGRLTVKAEQFGVAAHVKFHGWLAQPAAAERLRAADAFVLSSVHECGGAVVLEAMACGLPVVATAWGGPADYIDPSCGILVPPDSRALFIDGLATAMLKLAGDSSLRRTMGQAGRAKVKREYDWERKVDRILEVYASVCR